MTPEEDALWERTLLALAKDGAVDPEKILQQAADNLVFWHGHPSVDATYAQCSLEWLLQVAAMEATLGLTDGALAVGGTVPDTDAESEKEAPAG